VTADDRRIGKEPEGHSRTAHEPCADSASPTELAVTIASASADETLGASDVPPTTPGGTPIPRAPGTRLGRYVIERELGHGGMGVVYAARDPQLDRRVAVKVVSSHAPRRASEATSRQRLLREARAVARLSHPNVVAVHDVGIDNEEVFVAMELVDGQPLSAWLQQKRSEAQILAVFAQAGQGLRAAHAANIVHRDFKPDNVMVGADGRVRVLDFGLARPAQTGVPVRDPARLGASDRLEAAITQPGTLLGTPAYMAPEQFLGDPTDERTDQFSYCVSLYEALHGERPFEGENVTELMANVVSGRVRPAPGNRQVAAHLQAAILRGLSVDPAERYASLGQLLAALQNDPATRRRRRWRAGLAAVALAGAGATIAMGLANDSAGLCRAGSTEVGTWWSDARKRAIGDALASAGGDSARRTWTPVANELDRYTSEWVAGYTAACEATHVRGDQSAVLMDQRIACLRNGARVARAFVDGLNAPPAGGDKSNGHVAMPRLPSLEACADPAAVTARQARDLDPATQRRVEAVRAALAKAAGLRLAGKYEQAGNIVAALSTEGVDYAPVVAELSLERARQLQQAGKYEEAAPLFREALNESTRARDDRRIAQSALALAWLVGYHQRRPEQGHSWADMAEVALGRVTGANELKARLASTRGALFVAAGKHQEAVAAHQEALKARNPDKEPWDMALDLDNLGAAQYQLGAYDEALDAHTRALELKQTVVGTEPHPDLAPTLDLLGTALLAKDKTAEALEHYERAHALREQFLGQGHPDLAMSLDFLGRTYRRIGQPDKALARHSQALDIWIAALGEKHASVGISLLNVGYTLTALERFRDAVEVNTRAVGVFQHALGPEHPNVSYAYTALASAHFANGTYEDALRPLEQMLAMEAVRQLPPTMVAEAQFLLARSLGELGRSRARSRQLARTARAAWLKAEGTDQAKEIDAWLARK